VRLVGRAEFGWPASAAAVARPREGLVVHYDGADQGLARRAHADCVAYWKRTRRFHVETRGWVDIGYSFGACPHGVIFEGRGLDRAQAAQPGGNSTWYSVTLMLGPGEDPTPEQVDAVRQLRAWLMSRGVRGAVKGHRDFVATSCPGDRLYRMVRDGTFTRSPSREGDEVTARDVWTHEIKVPWGTAENPEWQAKSILINTNQRVRSVEAKLDAQNEVIKALAEAVAARTEVDVESLLARIRAELERVTVRLDVS
jgi:uncharacterized coiled-coil protein SlyX